MDKFTQAYLQVLAGRGMISQQAQKPAVAKETITSTAGMRNEPLGRIKWLYGKYFRFMSPEKMDEVARTAVEMTKAAFGRALAAGETIPEVYFNGDSRTLNNLDVISIDGDMMKYTAENPNNWLDNAGEKITDLTRGGLMSFDAVDYIREQSMPDARAHAEQTAARQKAAEDARKAKRDAEVATYNTDEYRRFQEDCRARFGATIRSRVLLGITEEMKEYLRGVFAQNPAIKTGLVNQIRHIHIADPNIEYLDGGGYYQQKRRDEESNQEVQRFGDMIESL